MSRLNLICVLLATFLCMVSAQKEICVPEFFEALNSLTNLDELYEFSLGTNQGATNQLNKWQNVQREDVSTRKNQLLDRITTIRNKYDSKQNDKCKQYFDSANDAYEKGTKALQTIIDTDHVPYVIGKFAPTYDANRAYIKELIAKCGESPCKNPEMVKDVRDRLAAAHDGFCDVSHELLRKDEKKSVLIRVNVLRSMDHSDKQMEHFKCPQKKELV